MRIEYEKILKIALFTKTDCFLSMQKQKTIKNPPDFSRGFLYAFI